MNNRGYKIKKKWDQIYRLEEAIKRKTNSILQNEDYRGRLTQRLRKKTYAYEKFHGIPDWTLHNKYKIVDNQIEELNRSIVDIRYKISSLKHEINQL